MNQVFLSNVYHNTDNCKQTKTSSFVCFCAKKYRALKHHLVMLVHNNSIRQLWIVPKAWDTYFYAHNVRENWQYSPPFCLMLQSPGCTFIAILSSVWNTVSQLTVNTYLQSWDHLQFSYIIMDNSIIVIYQYLWYISWLSREFKILKIDNK